MSREKILEAIKRNKPPLSPLPEINLFERSDINLLSSFKEVLSFVGGRPFEVNEGEDLSALIHSLYPIYQHSIVYSNVEGLMDQRFKLNTISDSHNLESLDLSILKAEFGVAENGAIWISTASIPFRVIPFITQHLVIILNKSNLVWNMHEAMERISRISEEGYGCFISGPSKTADIEQSLVIGAHGSRSLTLFLI